MVRSVVSWLVYTWGGLHRYFGIRNRVRSEFEAAVHYFARAYEIDPSFHQARLARAVLLWRELHDYAAALVDLDALLEENPHYAEALFNRAQVYQQTCRYQDALADLQSYLQLPHLDPFYRDSARRAVVLLQELLSAEEE